MKRLTSILFCLLTYSFVGYGQTFVPIDRIDWSLASDGDISGTTPNNGFIWTTNIPQADPDGSGVFAVQGGAFLIQDAEGTSGCPCDFDATTNCGQNDNALFIPAAVVMGYCQIKVSMTVSSSGNLECGGTPDELNPGCPSDLGAAWDGTDAMTIQITGNDLGDTDGHVICGDIDTGLVELIVNVSSIDAISLFITGGTQDADEFYSISNIVIEGVSRTINDLNLTLTTVPKINNSAIICENNSAPLKFQVAASANNASFEWTGPNGWTSTDASPEIDSYDPSWSGTYRVTVTDGNMCPIVDEIDVVILPSSDSNCRPQALFANLFSTQCSDFTLPPNDDDGLPGTWSPSEDLSLFADSSLIFTFTPTDTLIREYSQELMIFNVSESNRPADQPLVQPVFCNSSADEVDLIQLFNMNLDYQITVQGDIALFDKITTGESINNVRGEYETFSFLGVDPGVYRFFVDAVSSCQTARVRTISLSLTVVEQDPVILNENLCQGDYIDTLGYRIFGDTIITTEGVCDTVVVANINRLEPGTLRNGDIHGAGNGAVFTDCGNLVYFYGDIVENGYQGFFIQAELGEDPPRGPDYDTVFSTSYTGFFTLPYPASNGCDSITRISINMGNPTFTYDSIFLCPGEDTTVIYRGEMILIEESNQVEKRRTNQPGNSCTIHEIRGIYSETQRDTIQRFYCASQDTTIEGEVFDINNPSGVVSLAPLPGASCPSLLYVDLTFDEPERGTVVTSICAGETISIGGIDFSEAVTAMDIWLPTPASDGCDSIVTLTLTIQEFEIEAVNPTICSDSTFTFLGKQYNSNNSTGMDTIRTAQGCDSIIYEIDVDFFSDVALIVFPDTSFCANGSVFYPDYNVTLDANLLTYDTIVITPNGCSQTVMFSGTLLEVKDTLFQETICAGDTFFLGGQMLTSTGMYTESFIGATSSGCDSIVTVDLTVTQEIVEDISISICSGAEYSLGSRTISATGNYTEIFMGSAANGCDSTVNLELTVMAPAEFPFSESICAGGIYDFNGRILTEANEYRDTLSASNTCDSIVVLTLTILDPIVSTFADSTCEGLSYPWADEFLTESGMYPDTLTTSDGCDSIVILDLTVTPTQITTLEETICEGEVFEFDERMLTESGMYEDNDLVTFEGCDSIVRLTLTVFPIERITINRNLDCAGGTFTVGNNVYDSTNVYQDTLQTVNGCDSIITLDLVVPDSIITPLDTFICDGSMITLNGSNFDAQGIYDVLFFAPNGCDSIVRLNLEVIQAVEEDVSVVLCPGETVAVFNNSYGNSTDREMTETEFFEVNGTSSRGCDSTVNLTLTRVGFGPDVINRTICFDDVFQVGDSLYNRSGFYRDTLTSSFGCDSIIRLDLTVLPQYILDIEPTICTDGSYSVGDSVLTEPGFYSITLPSIDGCDSLLNVTLSIGDAFITNLNERLCRGEQFMVGDSIYTETGSYTDTISSFSGCDSIINLELFVIDPVRMPLITMICFGDTMRVGDMEFSESTTQSVTILSEEGCDSLILDLNLTVFEEINTVNTATLCPGGSVQVGDSVYTVAGEYLNTFTALTGCDSTVQTTITIRDSIVTEVSDQICTGGSVTIGDSVYTATGEYQNTLVSSDGCDSIVMLSLEVVDQIETNLEITICEGESFLFDGKDLNTTGQYQDTAMSRIGCDSIITLDLTVLSALQIDIENIIGSCEGVANGTFVISNIAGATPPFAVSGLPGVTTIDMLPFTVAGLSPETYSIDIADANGCTATIDVQITEDRDAAVRINSTTIDPSGLYELSLEFSGTIGSIAWDNIPGLSCYECPNPMVDILERTTFRVVITDVDGCLSTAEITLDVNGIGNVYVPNVFNPESTLGNHRFYIQGEDDSEAIYDLQVYDRWGNLVFETIGAALNDPGFGWDGTMRGRRLNADVYVYSCRVYDALGSEQVIKGDVTVMK